MSQERMLINVLITLLLSSLQPCCNNNRPSPNRGCYKASEDPHGFMDEKTAWAVLLVLFGSNVTQAATLAQRVRYLTARACAEHAPYGGYGGGSIRLPLEGWCNLFVECGHHQYEVQPCPVGQFFDGGICVDSELSHCPYDPCYNKEDGSQYSDTATCSGFFRCLRGVSHHHSCNDGHRYSSHTGHCVPDDTCSSNTHTSPLIAAGTCDHGQYRWDPDKPGMFFQRVSAGTYLQRSCPSGLLFDLTVCSCNYAQNLSPAAQTGHNSGGSASQEDNYLP